MVPCRKTIARPPIIMNVNWNVQVNNKTTMVHGSAVDLLAASGGRE